MTRVAASTRVAIGVLCWVRINAGPTASCEAYSNAATVTVCHRPTITQQPQSMVTTGGGSISVTASGDDLHYQWYQGPSGTTTTPVGTDSAGLFISVTKTTDFW